MAGPVVTIAGQSSSGIPEVGALVAEKLGVPLLDNEIISRAAQEAGISEAALRNAEKQMGLFTRMLESLGKFGAAGGEGVALEGISSAALLTTSSDFRALLERVLQDVAATGPAVILGHASQVALRDTPGTLHVFVHAPVEFRAARHARAQGISIEKARQDLEESDRERVKFYQTSYHVNWYDSRLYDVVVDTSLLGVHRAADMIAQLAQEALTAAPETPEVMARAASAGAPASAHQSTPLDLKGAQLHVRPMSPSDTGALLSLFRSLPPEDLLFLRRDVTSEHVVEAWARDVADGRMVTMLAEDEEGRVVGEASMRQSEVPWTSHVGEVRVITSPATRGRGLGRALLSEIMQAARAAGVDKLTAEMTVEQKGARRLFEGMGFKEEGRYHAYARDQEGQPHDLLVMTYTA